MRYLSISTSANPILLNHIKKISNYKRSFHVKKGLRGRCFREEEKNGGEFKPAYYCYLLLLSPFCDAKSFLTQFHCSQCQGILSFLN